MKSFSDVSVRHARQYKISFRDKPEYTILQLGTNDALNLPTNEILPKIKKLNREIKKISKDCRVIISTPIHHFDNWKGDSTVSELTNLVISLKIPIANKKNISPKHLQYNGLQLNN